MQDIDWNRVLINDDADAAYNRFQSILLTVFNEHFPIHTKSISNHGKSKPWITLAEACIQRIVTGIEKL